MIWFAVVLALLALMIPIIAIVLDSQLGRAIAGRFEKGPHQIGDDSTMRRVAQLEAEVERLNGQLQRIEEETTFLHRLLESKPAPKELPPGEHTS
jgi:hypothetical protein